MLQKNISKSKKNEATKMASLFTYIKKTDYLLNKFSSVNLPIA